MLGSLSETDDARPGGLRVRRLITRRFDLFGYGDTGGGCEADKLGWGGQTGSCGLGGVPDDAQQRPGLADDVIDGLLGDAEEVGQGSLRRGEPLVQHGDSRAVVAVRTALSQVLAAECRVQPRQVCSSPSRWAWRATPNYSISWSH